MKNTLSLRRSNNTVRSNTANKTAGGFNPKVSSSQTRIDKSTFKYKQVYGEPRVSQSTRFATNGGSSSRQSIKGGSKYILEQSRLQQSIHEIAGIKKGESPMNKRKSAMRLSIVEKMEKHKEIDKINQQTSIREFFIGETNNAIETEMSPASLKRSDTPPRILNRLKSALKKKGSISQRKATINLSTDKVKEDELRDHLKKLGQFNQNDLQKQEFPGWIKSKNWSQEKPVPKTVEFHNSVVPKQI